MLLNVFCRPRKAFNELAAEVKSGKFWLYAVALLIIASAGRAVAVVLNNAVNQPGADSDNLLPSAVAFFIMHLFVFLVSWHTGSWMISRIMPSFGGKSDQQTIGAVLILVFTPFLLMQPLTILPFVGKFAGYAGLLYSLVLLAWFTKHHQLVQNERSTGFVLVVFFIMAGTSYLLIALFIPLLRFFVF